MKKQNKISVILLFLSIVVFGGCKTTYHDNNVVLKTIKQYELRREKKKKPQYLIMPIVKKYELMANLLDSLNIDIFKCDTLYFYECRTGAPIVNSDEFSGSIWGNHIDFRYRIKSLENRVDYYIKVGQDHIYQHNYELDSLFGKEIRLLAERNDLKRIKRISEENICDGCGTCQVIIYTKKNIEGIKIENSVESYFDVKRLKEVGNQRQNNNIK